MIVTWARMYPASRRPCYTMIENLHKCRILFANRLFTTDGRELQVSNLAA